MANTPLGTPQGVPSSTDFLGSFKPPKTTSQAIEQEGQLISELAKATQAEGEAAAQAGVRKAELQAPIAKREAEAQKAAYGEYKTAADKMQDLEFKPTQESLMSMTGIASLTAIIGLMLGKTGGFSGQSAIDSMTGMMKGYQSGKADIFKQEQATFEKNVQAQKANLEKLKGKLDTALKMATTNRQAAEADIAVMLAEIDSDFLKAKYNKEGLKGVLDSVAKLEQAMAKRDELARKANVSGGSKSAINERFQNTVIRAANETLRSLQLMENIGIDVGKGAFGSVVGKGSLTSEAAANLGRAMTSQDQIRYNAAAGGMALELAYVLNGGYKPNETQITELKNLYLATPQDTYESAAFKFADVVAKLKASLEVAPAYTPEQKQNNQMLLEKMGKYATPEDILLKINGEPPKEDPYLRSSKGKTEVRRGNVTAGPNKGKIKVEYSDGTSEYVNE